MHEGFESFRARVVKHLKDGAKAMVSEMVVQGSVGPYDFVFSAGFEGFTKYCVDVMIMDIH